MDNSSVLDVETANLNKVSRRLVVICKELSYNCDFLGGVDNLARAEELLVAETERAEVASVFITDTIVTVGPITALDRVVTADLSSDTANVRGVGR